MFRAALAAMFAASAMVMVAIGCLLTRNILFGLAAAALAALLYLLFAVLIRHVDPAELKRRSRESEQQLNTLGRAMGKAAGGWELRRHGDGNTRRRHQSRPPG